MAARGPANGGDPRDKGPLRGSRPFTEARSRGTKKRRARVAGRRSRKTKWVFGCNPRSPRRPAPAPLALLRGNGTEGTTLRRETLARKRRRLFESDPSTVIAGLGPAISLRDAMPCPMNRDGRDKPGHDGRETEV